MKRVFFFLAFNSVVMFTIAAPAQSGLGSDFELNESSAADITAESVENLELDEATAVSVVADENLEMTESFMDDAVCEECGTMIVDPEVGCMTCVEEYPMEEIVDPCCVQDTCATGGGGFCGGGGGGGMGWLGLAGLAGLAGIGGGEKGDHGGGPASPYSHEKSVW